MPMMTPNLALVFIFQLTALQFFFWHRENLLHCLTEFLGWIRDWVRGGWHFFIGFHIRSFLSSFPVFHDLIELFFGRVSRKFSDSFLQVIKLIRFELFSISVLAELTQADSNSRHNGKANSNSNRIIGSEDRKHGTRLSIRFGIEV